MGSAQRRGEGALAKRSCRFAKASFSDSAVLFAHRCLKRSRLKGYLLAGIISLEKLDDVAREKSWWSTAGGGPAEPGSPDAGARAPSGGVPAEPAADAAAGAGLSAVTF